MTMNKTTYKKRKKTKMKTVKSDTFHFECAKSNCANLTWHKFFVFN